MSKHLITIISRFHVQTKRKNCFPYDILHYPSEFNLKKPLIIPHDLIIHITCLYSAPATWQLAFHSMADLAVTKDVFIIALVSSRLQRLKGRASTTS